MKNLVKILAILLFANAAYSYCPSGEELEKGLGIKDKVFAEKEHKSPIAKKMRDMLLGKESIYIGGANYIITKKDDSSDTNIATYLDGATITTNKDEEPVLSNITPENSQYYTEDLYDKAYPLEDSSTIQSCCQYNSIKVQFLGEFGDSCKYKMTVYRYVHKSPNCFADECSKDEVEQLYKVEADATLRFEKVS